MAHRKERCAHTDKFCYPSRKEAKQQLKHLRTLQGYSGCVYRCSGCGFFHVGSKPGMTHYNSALDRKRGQGGRKGR